MTDRKRRDQGRTGLIDGFPLIEKRDQINSFPGGTVNIKQQYKLYMKNTFFIMRKLDFFILCKSVVLSFNSIFSLNRTG